MNGSLPSVRRQTRSAARLQAAVAAAAPVAGPPVNRRRKAASSSIGDAKESQPLDKENIATEAGAPPPTTKKKSSAAGSGPSRLYERELWRQGYARVAGVDEAGRGPLAGPVVAAACVVPPHVDINGIDDSKKLNAEQREAIYAQLTGHPDVLWAVQQVDVGEIDSINILQAALKAMEGAVAALPTPADFLLVDGNRLPKGFDAACSKSIVKGDSLCFCIAAASVIAKVTRDRLMEQYHEQWPEYNFAGHKGYCVPEHVEAIRRHGPCPIHRRTFAPIKHWFPLQGDTKAPAASAGGATEGNKRRNMGNGGKVAS